MPIYAQELDPWLRASRGIGTMIAQRPVLAAQRAQLAQRQELYGAQSEAAKAHGELYRAQAGKYTSESGKLDAETRNLIRLGEAAKFLQENGGEAEHALATGDVNNPIIAKVHGAMQTVSGLKGKDLSAQEKTQIGTMLAARGQTYTAAAVENPAKVNGDTTAAVSRERVAQTAADQRAARPVVIPRNGTLAGPSGDVRAIGTQDVGIGHKLYAQPGVNVQPNPIAEGAPQAPKSSAVDTQRARFLAQTMKDLLETGKNLPNGMTLGDAVNERMRTYDAALGAPDEPTAEVQPAAAPAPQPAAPASSDHGYKVGAVYPHPQLGKLKYLGGDPTVKESWQPIQ